MKIIIFFKFIYSEIIKDLFKIIKTFIFVRQIKVNNPIGKILINNEYHEDFSWLSYLIGNRLKSLGYEVKYLVCNGNYYCERMTHTFTRPNCNLCYLSNIIKLKSFGHDYIQTNKIKNIQYNKNKKFDYKNILSKKQKKYIFCGININNIFNVSFLHYFKGKVKLSKKNLYICSKIFFSTIKNFINFSKIIEEYKPQKIVTINGKNIQNGVLYELSKNKKIDCYTWDVFSQGYKCMFSKNEIAHNQNISQNLWEKLSKKELSDYNKSRVKNYMQDQMLSLNTPLKYNDMNYEKDPQKILNLLGLKSAQKIISIFPNQDWDSTALGIDDAFKNQYDFLEYIFFLSKNFPNYHFILRPHPADAKLGKHARSVRTFDIYLSEKFRNKIPKNFIILKPGVELNSYSLAKISSHRIVYGSTLGLEFSFLKLKTIVAGAAFYKHRGFTIDVKKRYDINKILNQNNLNPRLSKKEHELLERFIYVSKFRKLFSLPFFSKNKFPICQISNNNFFFNKTINNISDYILDKRNYLDLDK